MVQHSLARGITGERVQLCRVKDWCSEPAGRDEKTAGAIGILLLPITNRDIGDLFLSQSRFRSIAKARRVSSSPCWAWAGMPMGEK